MYEYTAFISYRHKPLDIAVAKAIHTRLENFRIPSHIKKATGINKIGRCFRDRDELPTSSDLAQDIVTAMTNAAWLIVVCTPDTPGSKWCIAEIETFISLHGRSRVLAVLADGEPAESFPEVLRFEVTADDNRIEREPLAADLRAKSAFLTKRKLRTEKFRLLAPILGVGYDDLRRRARERVLRIALTASVAAVAVLAAFGSYVLYQSAIISRQNSEIIQKNDDLEVQITETNRQRELALNNEAEANRQRELALNNEAEAKWQANAAMLGQLDLLCELSKNAVAEGDRISGVRHALDSAGIYDALYPGGDEEKEEAIRQTLEGAVYSRSFQLLAPIRNNSRKLVFAEYSPDDSLILCGIGGFEAALVDAYTGEILAAISRSRPYMDNELAFLGFSPSGEYFVTGFGYSTCEIVVWKTGRSPAEAASYYSEENFVKGRFITDTELIFGRIGGYDEPHVWDFSTGKVRKPTDAQKADFISNPTPYPSGDTDDGVRLSPDGAYRYVDGTDQRSTIRIYEVSTGRCIGEISGATMSYAFSHNGLRLVAGNAAGFCGIFSTPASATAAVVSHYRDTIYQYPSYFDFVYPEPIMLNDYHTYDASIYYATQKRLLNEPGGRFMALIYPDSYVAVWDLEKDRADAAYIFYEHIGIITASFMTEEYLVTAGLDGRLMIFGLRDGVFLNSIIVEDGVVALNIDPSGSKAVAVGRSLRSAYVYDLNTGLPIYRLDAEPGDLVDYTAVGFSKDGRKVIVKQQSGRTIIGELFFTLGELKDAAGNVYQNARH